MKNYQFSCCSVKDGILSESNELTPVVQAESATEAMKHPDIQSFFKERPGLRIYRWVR